MIFAPLLRLSRLAGPVRPDRPARMRRTAPARALACALFAALTVCAPVVCAQVRPEIFEPSPGPGGTRGGDEGEITIELDTSRARNADKSLGLALFASAVLPGAGEAYLGEGRSARSFLLTEAGFWAGLFISYQMRESYMQSARNHASQHAGADAARWGETMLERAASYRASHETERRQDSYEMYYILANNGRELALAEPDHPYWDFGSSNTPENTRNWKEYQSVMRHYRGAKVAMSFAVGALVLNRAASMAHTLRVYRRTSGKGLSYRFDPEWGPESSGIRLSVTF